MSRFESPRSWRKPRVERAGAGNDRGPNPWPPVGPGRNQQGPVTAAKGVRTDRESGVVREETAPPEGLGPRNSSGSVTS
jgi:hypothetical protein